MTGAGGDASGDTPGDTRASQGLGGLMEALTREQVARARAERAVDRVTHLQMITEGLARALTVGEIAQVIMERGLPGVGAAAGSVGLLSDDGTVIEVIGDLGYPTSLASEFRFQPV